jgi:hypothetical protein
MATQKQAQEFVDVAMLMTGMAQLDEAMRDPAAPRWR